jgi:hypothetical protein
MPTDRNAIVDHPAGTAGISLFLAFVTLGLGFTAHFLVPLFQ